MEQRAIQSYYEGLASHCYGCGQLNDQGLKVESYWDGEAASCNFRPKPYHTSFPGYAYGGLIASLVDCHSMATAAAANYQAEGRPMDSQPALRYVTGSLHVDYLRPTPRDTVLTLRAWAREIKGRKTVVTCSVYANGQETARAEVLAVRMPDNWLITDG